MVSDTDTLHDGLSNRLTKYNHTNQRNMYGDAVKEEIYVNE